MLVDSVDISFIVLNGRESRMGKYTKIKSNFIKEKLKQTRWQNRFYIDNLIFLEKAILRKFKGYGCYGNIKLYKIKNEFKNEFETIFKELDLKEWEKYNKKEKVIKEKLKNMEEGKRKQQITITKRKKDNWVKAGGKN